jgi:hypothetical protein
MLLEYPSAFVERHMNLICYSQSSLCRIAEVEHRHGREVRRSCSAAVGASWTKKSRVSLRTGQARYYDIGIFVVLCHFRWLSRLVFT